MTTEPCICRPDAMDALHVAAENFLAAAFSFGGIAKGKAAFAAADLGPLARKKWEDSE
jgi:hypothetical protein